MTRFDSIDLSQLPKPAVVEVLDAEAYMARYRERLKERLAARGFDWDMEAIEQDAGTAAAETTGFREMILRGRINDAATSVMLAYATGTDLDQIAARYGVQRMEGETDAMFRTRVQLAPEALTVAGSAGAYAFHARSASTQIVDVAVFSPSPGRVDVLPLIASDDGIPSDGLIELVRRAVTAENRKPLTDYVVVRKPAPRPFSVAARLVVGDGPDPALIRGNAMTSLDLYLASRRRIGAAIYTAGLLAALKVPGVENVILDAPLADVMTASDEIATLASVDVKAQRATTVYAGAR